VVERCGLVRDLEQWPSGLDTQVGERGIQLSGGQKVRIALARALYHVHEHPAQSVCLLDNPLASLDVHTARHVLQRAVVDGLVRRGCAVLLASSQEWVAAEAGHLVLQLAAAGPPRLLSAAEYAPGAVLEKGAADAEAGRDESAGARASGVHPVVGSQPAALPAVHDLRGAGGEKAAVAVEAEGSTAGQGGGSGGRAAAGAAAASREARAGGVKHLGASGWGTGAREHTAQGRVKVGVYSEYGRAGSAGYSAALAVFAVLAQVMMVRKDLVLSSWADSTSAGRPATRSLVRLEAAPSAPALSKDARWWATARRHSSGAPLPQPPPRPPLPPHLALANTTESSGAGSLVGTLEGGAPGGGGRAPPDRQVPPAPDTWAFLREYAGMCALAILCHLGELPLHQSLPPVTYPCSCLSY